MNKFFDKPDFQDGEVLSKLVINTDYERLLDVRNISAVCGIVFYIDAKGKFNLLTTKNERGLDIPGGHIEKLDTSVYAALSREINEETGLNIEPSRIESFALAADVHQHEQYMHKMIWFGIVQASSEQVHDREWRSFEDFLKQYSQVRYKELLSWLLINIKNIYESH